MGRVATILLVVAYVGHRSAFAETKTAPNDLDQACEVVAGEAGCQPVPKCKDWWSDYRCGWAQFGAQSPAEFARTKTDAIRVIGDRDYGNLHLFVEFTRSPEGLAVMGMRDVYGEARAVTVRIAPEDWSEVRSRVETFIRADERQRAINAERKRRQEELDLKSGTQRTIVCTDGISASLEVVDKGNISFHPLASCENPPVVAFADYIEAKAYSLVPGCALLRKEAIGYCLGLAGDAFAAAEIANGLPILLGIDCNKRALEGAARGKLFFPHAGLNIAGSDGGDKSASARWESVSCSSPRWEAYPISVFAKGNSGAVDGTVQYEVTLGTCPSRTVINHYSRLFRQNWGRDVTGVFRVKQWEIGPETLISTSSFVCAPRT